ncbi:MAG: sulfotransferase domain-containing protein [Bacteroidia bacterium]
MRIRKWKKVAFMPRLITSSFRALPNFILIGAQKGGSSALYKFICEHPKVKRAFIKEPHYFSGRHKTDSLNWYRALFPLKQANTITGEASPSYITHPLSPLRIKDLLPQAKLILIVRNPVERALSNYFHSVKYNREDLSIEKAFARPIADFELEYNKMRDNDGYHSQFYYRHGYIHKGFYDFHLANWYMHFAKEQLLVVENNELLNEPEKVYNKVLDFLELEPFRPDAFNKVNVGSTKKVDEGLKEELAQYFETSNQRFFEMIGKTYDW